MATEASTGKPLWSTPLNIKPSEQFVVSDKTIFLGSSDHTLYALKKSNGQVIWKKSYKDLTTVGNHILDIAPFAASDGKTLYFGGPRGIYAWSAEDGHLLWSYSTPKSCSTQQDKCESAVVTVKDGVVYAYLDGLYALNASNGTMSWKNSAVPDGSRLVVVQDHIYVAYYGGGAMRVLNTTDYLRGRTAQASEDLYALRNSDSTVIWHNQYKNIAFSIRDGNFYYISQKQLATDTVQSQPTKPITTNDLNNANPESAGTFQVCKAQSSDGKELWCKQLPGNFVPLLAEVRGDVLYITVRGKVESIRLSDMKVLWTVSGNSPSAHSESTSSSDGKTYQTTTTESSFAHIELD